MLTWRARSQHACEIYADQIRTARAILKPLGHHSQGTAANGDTKRQEPKLFFSLWPEPALARRTRSSDGHYPGTHRKRSHASRWSRHLNRGKNSCEILSHVVDGRCQAASAWVFVPSMNRTPAITSDSSCEPLSRRHFLKADCINLTTMARQARRNPLPLVRR